MASDLSTVLPKLIRANLWSRRQNLCQFKHVILDASSIATHLYRQCIQDHLRRQKSIISSAQAPDLYSATLVNYCDYSRLIRQLFDFLADHHLEPIVVYAGKPTLEPFLYGSVAAEVTSSTQRVGDLLASLISYDNTDTTSASFRNFSVNQIGLPELAMNIFKLIVNNYSNNNNNNNQASGYKRTAIRSAQAYYSAYPLLAKLARDFECPVITNDCEFILMDVRAGFVLFESLWLNHIELHNLVTNDRRSKSRSLDRKSQPKSVIKLEKRPARSADGGGGGGGGGGGSSSSIQVDCKFYYNSSFLRQHPGLTPESAIYLFPLSNVDFVTSYPSSLKRVRVFASEYKRRDYLPSTFSCSRRNESRDGDNYSKYHGAANRLEQALTYLSGRDVILLSSLMRGEALKVRSGFGADFRFLSAKYVVAHDFKKRLKSILKPAFHQELASEALNYIEMCLVQRECTANFLVDILCCSIGQMVGKTYNSSLSFEDLRTKKSAHSMSDRAKSILMSLFNSKQSQNLIKSSSQQQQQSKQRLSAALITIDREQSNLVETLVDNASTQSQVADSIRDQLQLSKLTRKSQALKAAASKLINQAFMSANLLQLAPKLQAIVNPLLGQQIQHELAIVRSLFKFCLQTASTDDAYIRRVYAKISPDFELAIVNHYLYLNQVLEKQSKKDLSTLTDLIVKRDFENVANLPKSAPISQEGSKTDSKVSASAQKSSQLKGKTKSISSQSKSATAAAKDRLHQQKQPAKSSTKSISSSTVNKQIRHLIEMLNSALAAYFELNAFFDYPLPSLRLHLNYNPVLIYNLALYSHEHPSNKILIRF